MTAAPALYRIAAAARMTGVSEHTLRVWDRRYGALASHRTEAGYRLYTNDDVERINRLRELVEAGHAIGEVAKLSPKELFRLRNPPRAHAPETLVAAEAQRRFLAAVESFDLLEAARLMAAARIAFSPFELASEVIAPLLVALGERWVDGPDDAVAQEHAATTVLRDELMRLLFVAPRIDVGLRLIVAAPEAEFHEFGALLAAVVAAHAGAHVLYLGPNMPARDLARAAKKDRSRVVLLSVVSLDTKRARSYCKLLRAKLAPNVRIWTGGHGAKALREKDVEHVATLERLRAAILSGR